MFTGIIQALGQISQVSGHRVCVETRVQDNFLSDVHIGDSIAVNGACMTVVAKTAQTFDIDVSQESLNRTVGLDRCGPVNLEKAMRPADRLGGHMVSGHVDGLATVIEVAPASESWHMRLSLPTSLSVYVTEKGSIAINGVSLTVNAVKDGPEGTEISVNLIPHTWENTSLQFLKKNDQVNVEVDQLAKQVMRALERLESIRNQKPRSASG